MTDSLDPEDKCPECKGSGCKYCQGTGTSDHWTNTQHYTDEGYKNICEDCIMPKCNRQDDSCLIIKAEHDALDHEQEIMSLHG
jgi:hypothetical protein